MNELQQWLADNDRHLAAELAAVRARLERLAADAPTAEAPPTLAAPAVQATTAAEPPEPPPPAGVGRRGRSSLWPWRRRTSPPAPPPAALEAQALPQAAPPVPEPLEAGAATEDPGRPSALTLLARRFGLSDFERQTLVLCAATELDTRVAGLCARVQGEGRAYPTFALALTAFDEPAWDVLSRSRPLRYWRLIEVNQPAGHPLITAPLTADERIVNYLKGLNHLDDRLAPLVREVPADDLPLPPSQAAVANAIVTELDPSRAGRQRTVFQLLGADRRSKLAVARAAAAELGLALHELTPEAVPTDAAEQDHFLRLWQRETALLPVSVFVDTAGFDPTSPQVTAVFRMCARGLGVTFVGATEPRPELTGACVQLDVLKPTPAEQRDAWAEALGAEAGDRPSLLAGQFNFDLPTIRRLADSVGTVAGSPDAVWAACLRESRPSLEQLAQVIDAKAGWDDLELPPEEKRLLRQIADQVGARMAVYDDWGFRQRMNRGLGISVLFAGESGTGKTMAAEVMARELGLHLYRIDLSAVVSKYIGETEKNLRRLFDAAEDGGAILFFDEADALFGKRSEVKDSHDRYANIEINYLLQRMEAYRGLAILATNAKSALDEAFVRRLRFIVDFRFPGVDQRAAIWQKVFPDQTPTAGLDHRHLARFNLTGGSIHSIAVNAAFLAAGAGTPVTMPLVLDAVRTEFAKLNKPVNEADFRWLEPVEGTG